MKQLPTAFVSRMRALLGDEGYGRYEKALSEPPSRALRVNTEKISLEEFEAIAPFPIEKIPYVENGYFFDCDRIGSHPFHHAGMIYVQESAAMMPAECLDIQPDWKILDLCAAPGGKSTQLKNKLGNKGVLISNEIISSRCKILASNIERLGLINTVTTCLSPEKIAALFEKTFDMIMVDAPCSGEGMFRKEEIAIDEWSEGNVKMCAERQAEILENAVKALKDGGYIVYSTCTFSLEENEMTVDKFLSRHPDFELLPVKAEVREASENGINFGGCGCDHLSYTRRFYPHTGKGEGQFMALLHSKAEPCEDSPHKANVSIKPKKSKKGARAANTSTDTRAVTDFLDAVLVSYDKSAVKFKGEAPIYFPSEMSLDGVPTFTCGVLIGEIKKNYLLPHHSFFMAMGSLFKNKIDLSPDSEELKKYLHGEEIEVGAPDGWAVITVCGCAVGGVKVVSGVAKNHYPKGLRTKA